MMSKQFLMHEQNMKKPHNFALPCTANYSAMRGNPSTPWCTTWRNLSQVRKEQMGMTHETVWDKIKARPL